MAIRCYEVWSLSPALILPRSLIIMLYFFLSCGLALSLLTISLFHFLSFFNPRSTTNGSEDPRKPRLPPGSTGLPLIGETFAFLNAMRKGHLQKFIFTRMAKHSPDVFMTSLLGSPLVVMCGAAGTKFIFTTGNRVAKAWKPESIMKLLFEDRFVASPEWVASIADFVKADNLRKLVGIMDSMAQKHLETHWHGKIVVHASVKSYTIALACQTFLSTEDTFLVEEMIPLYEIFMTGVYSMPINFPRTAYSRAIKASKVLKAKIIEIIRQKRSARFSDCDHHEYKSFLSFLLEIIGINDSDIAGIIVGSIFAARETNDVITMTLMTLSKYPDIYQRVYEGPRVVWTGPGYNVFEWFAPENMEVSAKKPLGEPLRWDDIQKLKYTWNVVEEVMRIHTPGPGAFREATVDFTYAGYHIPKGTKIFLCANALHMDPKYFINPERFDPSRFEDTRPTPHTFIPFGGGLSMCKGRVYAQIVILSFIHNVIKKFKWKSQIPDEKVIMNPFPCPANGFPILVHRNPVDGQS